MAESTKKRTKALFEETDILLGVPWLYPGRVKEKRRKALRHLRLLDFLWLLKAAQKRL